jgi:energy-coupling factor transporter ATP-binding protein EcfA2
VITEIEIEGFKSLEKVHLKLGGLNLFIGANASGKSNFLEALRVFQGIGYGFAIDEIFNGKPKGASSDVWEGIRGGSPRARFFGSASQEILFRVNLVTQGIPRKTSYSIRIDPEHGAVRSEKFEIAETVVIERQEDLINRDGAVIRDLEKGELEIHHHTFLMDDKEGQIFEALMSTLGNQQHVAPHPDVLRDYGQRFLAERMGESGENFASLVKAILKDPESASAYLSWLRQLVPLEAKEIEIREGALGEPLFGLKSGNQFFPAPILSDGTLRFAAITAAFFQPDMPDIITLEEIENGIHPSRLRLLMELLKSQSGGSGPQVFATTHSPVVLAWLEEKDYETTFLCKRDEETGASIIKPLSEIPHLIDLVRKQPIGELFTEGWLEGAF